MRIFGLAMAVTGCDEPCADYCQAFAEKAASCELGGPGDSAFIDACTTQVEKQLSTDQCEQAELQIDRFTCDAFREIVCAQPDADLVYACDGGDPPVPVGGAGAGGSEGDGGAGAGFPIGGSPGMAPFIDPAPCLVGGNVLYVNGEPDDFVHPGEATYLDAVWTNTSDPFRAIYFVDPSDQLESDWFVELTSMPTGEPLAIGVYEDAEKFDNGPVGSQPGIDIGNFGGAGAPCQTVTGRFEVFDIEVTGDTITRFTATFEQRCEPATGVMRGCVHYEE